jgi:hypothetical protein
MDEPVRGTENSRDALRGGGVELMSRAELAHCRHWRNAFVGGRKDHRFYELVEDTSNRDSTTDILLSRAGMARFWRFSRSSFSIRTCSAA